MPPDPNRPATKMRKTVVPMDNAWHDFTGGRLHHVDQQVAGEVAVWHEDERREADYPVVKLRVFATGDVVPGVAEYVGSCKIQAGGVVHVFAVVR